MTSVADVRSRAFLEKYAAQSGRLARCSTQAVDVVRKVVSAAGIDFHGVDGRAKTLSSVRDKLRRKAYGAPWRQLTDKIGVRIMTYYREDVDPAVEALKNALEIDVRQSVDKRSALGLREFGYSSVHLIARTRGAYARAEEYADLADEWFEIQIRSVLEHAWAEIEHEVVYKSGLPFPESTRRRFAALAGTLELLEGEFSDLRKEGRRIVDIYRNELTAGKRLNSKLDVARMLGALEMIRPDALPFLERDGSRLRAPASTTANCVSGLRVAGIRTPRMLIRHLRKKWFIAAVQKYAAECRVPEESVSQLALVAILIGSLKRPALEEWLPELLADRALLSAFAVLRRRGRVRAH